ncbi:winged helix DNA-binding protein [Erythrobacter insulae]|uniref:winged helix DNA-binding protein n=1 Tax=Erythrobacter insulae TaxID=2584124 RepID=UPI003898ED56
MPEPIEAPTRRETARLAYAAWARDQYATRRRRETVFRNAELFGEPAWDILLDLYIAYVDQKTVSVSSACIGSAAPSTTGLRWLGILAEQGLVTREHDPDDQRRVLVRLSDHGLETMDAYFESVASAA